MGVAAHHYHRSAPAAVPAGAHAGTSGAQAGGANGASGVSGSGGGTSSVGTGILVPRIGGVGGGAVVGALEGGIAAVPAALVHDACSAIDAPDASIATIVSLLCKYQQTAAVVQAACRRLQAGAAVASRADAALLRSSGVPQLLAAMYWHPGRAAVAAELSTTLYRIVRTCSTDVERAELQSMCYLNRKYMDAALTTAQPSLPPRLVATLRAFMSPPGSGGSSSHRHHHTSTAARHK